MSRRRRGLAVVLVAGAALSLALVPATAASAHPLGNASVNHYDGLTLFRDHVEDHAVEDVAEIPTYQRKPVIDADGDGALSAAERSTYAGRRCRALASSVKLSVSDTPARIRVRSAGYSERPSAAVRGLSIGRLTCSLTAKADLSQPTTVGFRDGWDGAGIGWHEVTAVGNGVSLKDSPVADHSISQQLRHYPNDLLSSPLDVRSADLHVTPGGGRSTYQAAKDVPVAGFFVRQLSRLGNAFSGLVGVQHLTLGVGLLAVVLALMLGAGHALLPGHGKTIMAAYVVGKNGRMRDVAAVGATVTITHTAGVLVLGLLLTTSTAFAPTAIEQVLGAISGLIIVVVGVVLLVKALRRRGSAEITDELAQFQQEADLADLETQHTGTAGGADTTERVRPLHVEMATAPAVTSASAAGGAQPAGPDGTSRPTDRETTRQRHTHSHGHNHGHGHSHGHSHGHGHGGDRTFTRGGLLGLGIAGGLVPSPSALIVLLGAVTLGRTVFGVLLVLAYGVGMAATLTGAALLMVRLRDRLGRRGTLGRFRVLGRLAAWAPVLTAVLVVLVGIGVTLRAVAGTV